MKKNKRLTAILLALLVSLTVVGTNACTTSHNASVQTDPVKPDSVQTHVTTVITNDPATSVKLTWQGEGKTVSYVKMSATGSADFNGAQKVEAETVNVPDGKDRNDESRTGYDYNHAVIAGLSPDTTYAYKIGASEGTFKTAASDGSFNFIYFSDPQVTNDFDLTAKGDQPNYLAAAFKDIKNNAKNKDTKGNAPALACMGGDYTDYYRNNEFQVLFDAGKDFFANTLVAGAEGNHDYNRENYAEATNFLEDYFGFPSTVESSITLRNVYSFDYGMAHFIFLNSNYIFETFDDKAPINAITSWLEKDLAASKARDKKWNIVVLHGSAYCAGGHAWDVADIADTFAPLFENNGVDAVLSGHDHNIAMGFIKYDASQDTKGVKVDPETIGGDANSVIKPANVPFYMTGGTMGDCKWYDLDPDFGPLFRIAEALDHVMSYNCIEVSADSLKIHTRTLDLASVKSADAATAVWTDHLTFTVNKAK